MVPPLLSHFPANLTLLTRDLDPKIPLSLGIKHRSLPRVDSRWPWPYSEVLILLEAVSCSVALIQSAAGHHLQQRTNNSQTTKLVTCWKPDHVCYLPGPTWAYVYKEYNLTPAIMWLNVHNIHWNGVSWGGRSNHTKLLDSVLCEPSYNYLHYQHISHKLILIKLLCLGW